MTPFKDNITKSIDNLNKLQEDVDNIITEQTETITELQEQVEEMENLQTKDVTITENGTTEITADSSYYALEKVNLTVNAGVSSDIYGLFSNCVPAGIASQNQDLKTCLELKDINVDFSNFQNGKGLFSYCKSITEINANINNKTDLDYCFSNCTKLKTCNLTNTSQVTIIASIFDYCSMLENINVFDLSGCTKSYQNAFRYCNALTNDSLHNIIKTFLTLNNTNPNTKTLKFLGLSSEQATTCTSFDEWTTLVADGWTTGYET